MREGHTCQGSGGPLQRWPRAGGMRHSQVAQSTGKLGEVSKSGQLIAAQVPAPMSKERSRESPAAAEWGHCARCSLAHGGAQRVAVQCRRTTTCVPMTELLAQSGLRPNCLRCSRTCMRILTGGRASEVERSRGNFVEPILLEKSAGTHLSIAPQ